MSAPSKSFNPMDAAAAAGAQPSAGTATSRGAATGRFMLGQLRAAAKPTGARRSAAASGPHASASWAWALAALALGLVVGVLWFAPARWLAHWVALGSQERVVLHAAQGTIWNGTSRLVLAAGAGSRDAQTLPGLVQWRIRPNWRGLSLALTADCCATSPIEAKLTLGLARIDIALDGAPSNWPASLLTGLGTPLNTLAPTGTLELQFQGFRLQRVQNTWAFQGSAQLQALQLSSRLSTLKPLGSYRLDFKGGDVLGVTLATTSGALNLSGSGQWVDGRLRFRGEAQASGEHDAALANLINIMTRRENGKAVINIG
jgi:general secretion pathway protein N